MSVFFYIVLVILLFIRLGITTIKSKLYYYPIREDIYWCDKPNDAIEDVYIDSSSGIKNDKLHGWYYCPVDITDTTKIVLACHGNSGNVATNCEMVNKMIDKNIPFLIFDYKGFGRSSGVTTIHSTYDDAEACFKYLITKKFKPENIIPHGTSIGSYPATRLATEYKLPKLIIVAGLHKISDVIMDILPYAIGYIASCISYGDLDVGSYLKKYSGKYILFHSKKDEIVGYDNAVKNSKYGGLLVEINGMHNDNNVDWNTIKKFIYG
jgi:hypothetical protein